VLAEGDAIGADARLVEAASLRVQELRSLAKAKRC